jgi:hypothetical protein
MVTNEHQCVTKTTLYPGMGGLWGDFLQYFG